MDNTETISIFIPNTQESDGIKEIRFMRDNRKAFFFPRNAWGGLTLEEGAEGGIYFLIGEGEIKDVYVGEGVFMSRFKDHNRNEMKDFWSFTICFPTNDQERRYIEKILIREIKEIHNPKFRLTNIQNIENNIIPPNEILPTVNQITNNIKLLFNIFGLNLFNSLEEDIDLAQNQYEIFTCTGGGAKARGRESNQGFVVMEGSTMKMETGSETFKNRGYLIKIEELKENAVISEKEGFFVFQKDYPFSSPSYAASIILGYMASGNDKWINKKGITLGDFKNM